MAFKILRICFSLFVIGMTNWNYVNPRRPQPRFHRAELAGARERVFSYAQQAKEMEQVGVELRNQIDKALKAQPGRE